MNTLAREIIEVVSSIRSPQTLYVLKGFNYWIDDISDSLGGNYLGFIPGANAANGLNLPELNKHFQSGHPIYITYEASIWMNNASLAGVPPMYKYKTVVIENDIFDTYYPDIPQDSLTAAKKDQFNSDIDDPVQQYYGEYDVRGTEAYIVYNDTGALSTESLYLSQMIDATGVNWNQESIEIPDEYDGVALSQNMLSLINRSVSQVSFLVDTKDQPDNLRLISVLEKIGITVSYRKFSTPENVIDEARAEKYLSVLKRKNSSYDFQNLKVYKDPYETTELVDVSQIQVIDTIVSNSLLAQSSESFLDVFVTAPTGAGKSVMFQIPAIYLAETSNLLTIVVSPLIGLMNDQVDNIKSMTNLAATINSDYTPIEKEDTLDRVKAGEVSILYLSPESLLSNTDITNLIGDRKIGLVVIDEAHIVATWGKSFRPDYWYLGDFIHKLRTDKKSDHSFPIVTFTATATFGGNDNMYQEIIESLHMTPTKFIGNVKRDDINFDIRHKIKDNAYQEEKLATAIESIDKLQSKNEKSLVYAPYTRHIADMYEKLSNRDKAGRYYGGMTPSDKNETLRNIKSGEINLVIATKAFGMGIDIDDIKNVYHFAPTGNVADYVQEIGRAARRKDMIGTASTDFYKEDFRYVNQLYGMSSIKNYQLVAVLKKIYELYTKYNKRNFLVAPDEFSYIYADQKPDEVDAKLKTTLLMIKKDFESDASQTYIPLIFKPRSMFTQGFFTINDDFVDTLQSLNLMRFFEKMPLPRVVKSSQNGSTVTTTQSGDTYKLDFKRLWEHGYKDISFAMFKRQFFENELKGFNFKVGEKILARVIIEVDGGAVQIKDIRASLLAFLDSLEDVFSSLKQANRYFTTEELALLLIERTPIKRKPIAEMMSSVLLPMLRRINTGSLANQFGFFSHNSKTNKYVIRNIGYERVIQSLKRYARGMLADDYATKTVRYCQNKSDGNEIIIAQLIELLETANAKISSGSNPEFFIRVNSPYAIEKIIKNPNYSSKTVRMVKYKHYESAQLMEHFFTNISTDEDRWGFIEQYFLGRVEVDDINPKDEPPLE